MAASVDEVDLPDEFPGLDGGFRQVVPRLGSPGVGEEGIDAAGHDVEIPLARGIVIADFLAVDVDGWIAGDGIAPGPFLLGGTVDDLEQRLELRDRDGEIFRGAGTERQHGLRVLALCGRIAQVFHVNGRGRRFPAVMDDDHGQGAGLLVPDPRRGVTPENPLSGGENGGKAGVDLPRVLGEEGVGLDYLTEDPLDADLVSEAMIKGPGPFLYVVPVRGAAHRVRPAGNGDPVHNDRVALSLESDLAVFSMELRAVEDRGGVATLPDGAGVEFRDTQEMRPFDDPAVEAGEADLGGGRRQFRMEESPPFRGFGGGRNRAAFPALDLGQNDGLIRVDFARRRPRSLSVEVGGDQGVERVRVDPSRLGGQARHEDRGQDMLRKSGVGLDKRRHVGRRSDNHGLITVGLSHHQIPFPAPAGRDEGGARQESVIQKDIGSGEISRPNEGDRISGRLAGWPGQDLVGAGRKAGFKDDLSVIFGHPARGHGIHPLDGGQDPG